MPRSSSTPRSRTAIAPVRAPSPVRTVTTVAAAPSLGETFKHSIAAGVGSSIGHRIVGSILGPPRVEVASASCGDLSRYREELSACLKDGGDCQTHVAALERCLKGGQ
jgi:hypothetical protein